jgi:RNA polymerase sigma factor for flagellar operon FliA
MYPKSYVSSPEALIETHGALVKKVANHLLARLPASVSRDDLIQAGMLGLLEAAKRFDASKGASFETFVSIRIKGAMLDEVRKNDWAPRSVHRNARLISEAISRVENRPHQDASDTNIAEEMGLTLADYHQLLKECQGSRIFNFSELMNDDEEGGLDAWMASSSLGPSEEVEEQSFNQHLGECLAQLPERERLVLALYYNEELNLKEIGDVLGVSESRVSQIHTQAALRLRARLHLWQ